MQPKLSVPDELSELIVRLTLLDGSKEPALSGKQLTEVDELAKHGENIRLKGLGVLLPVESLLDASPKQSKYVITWREKTIDGERHWLGRARHVAKEFAWLARKRQGLSSFSQHHRTATPHTYLVLEHGPERSCVLRAMDITDAFVSFCQLEWL